jgi:hypothetical protein
LPSGHRQLPSRQRFGASQQTPPQKSNPGALGQHEGFHSCDGTIDPSGRLSAPGPKRTQPLWILRSQQTPLTPLSGWAIRAVHGNVLLLLGHVLMQRKPLSRPPHNHCHDGEGQQYWAKFASASF